MKENNENLTAKEFKQRIHKQRQDEAKHNAKRKRDAAQYMKDN